MKKFILLIFIIVCFFGVSSCKKKDSIEKNALTIMGKKSDLTKPYMTRIFKLYEEETKEKLNIISIEDKEYETTATKKFQNNDIPDIFMHFNNADLFRFNVEDNFYMLNQESWVEDLIDSAYSYCLDSEGNLLGLPFWEDSVSGCYYNKTLLNNLGLKEAATQSDFNGLCEAICDLNLTPICWAADGCSWMPQFGLDPIFADNPEVLSKLNANELKYADIKEVRQMVKWISDASKNGWFGKDYLKTGWEDISKTLSSGKAIMTFIWDSWFYTDFKGGEYTVDDFALMPIFMNTAEEGTYESGNLNMLMVNKNSLKKEKALSFLSFCATAENYNKAFEGIATLNCFKGQTTNIQSPMVLASMDSVEEKQRVSTASTKIIGYSGDDVSEALNDLFRDSKREIDQCIKQMDEKRIYNAKRQGFPSF